MANESGFPAGSTPTDRSDRGWGGDEVTHDHGDEASGSTGWAGGRVVRDQAKDDEAGKEAGWSGPEVVKDRGAGDPTSEDGGWSGTSIVKDEGTA